MKRTPVWLACTALVTVVALIGCSSDSSTPTQGGGGNKEFDSGTLTPGATYSHVFMTAKVVPYHCAFHGSAGGGGMSGTITVQAAGSPTLHTVSMTSALTFVPALLTINAGDTVKWVNNATMNHTATSDN